jgi:hypothetical protein
MRIISGAVCATTVLAVSASSAVAQGHLGAELIPSSRLVDWAPGVTVGVPGGIPATRTKCNTTACEAVENAPGSYRDGSTNAAPLIQAAISSAPADTFVFIPAGTWRLDATLSIGPSDSRVTVRGVGEGTVMAPRGQAGAFFVGSSSDWQWAHPAAGNTVLSGLTKGSTQISVSDTTPFSVGAIAQLKFENENAVERPIISVAGFPYLRKQFVRIVGKSASTLSFYPALYNNYSGSARVAVAQLQVDLAGIEDMRIEAANSTATFVVFFEQTFGSWIKNVRVRQGKNYNVFFNDSLQCELRGSYLDELNHGGTNGAGLLMNTVTGCLIEDNIIRDAFPGVEVNHGSSGNVFAYNFLNNTNGTIGFDTNHGPHNDFNLYEGNIVHNLMSDGYFGSTSDDTLYRNWFTGVAIAADPAPANPASNSLTWCVSLKRFTRNYSIVGNILGSGAPHAASWECDSYGQPNIGNGSSIGEAQPTVGKYWEDWNPLVGTNLRGAITARHNVLDYKGDTCVNCVASLNLTSGRLTVGQTPMLRFGTGASTWGVVKSVTGSTAMIDASAWSTAMPVAGTSVELWPGAAGYQELDLDVRSTTLKKGNYSHFSRSIPAAEALAGVSLPPSLFRRSKPAFFGDRNWPAFDPTNPNLTYDSGNPYRSYEVIPAAYRYFRGSSPPGVSASGPPSIDAQPKDLSVAVGQSATFTVAASGAPNPTYQWRRNGAPIAGATLPLYSTPVGTTADSGAKYSCVVTNASGAVTSREAVLTVGGAPAPAAPLNLRVRP